MLKEAFNATVWQFVVPSLIGVVETCERERIYC